MDLTKKQRMAVDTKNKNILVSAAAGSGKTAVLVTRIIDRVLDEEAPIDIDRILVMTFTKAAASQMRERILKAIEEKRALRPHDKNLQKQAALVHSANITTIDSFCLNVVRNHFAEIDLNPDFRIADEGEINLLKRDALDEVLEELYEKGDESFLNMTETFAAGKNDNAIDGLILNLHMFADSYVNPDEWLMGCASKYSFDNETDIKSNKSHEKQEKNNGDKAIEEKLNSEQWIQNYVDGIKSVLKEVSRNLDTALNMCSMEFGPFQYADMLENDIAYIDGILFKNTYTGIYSYIEEMGKFEPMRLAQCPIPKEGKAPLEEIEIRKELKDKVSTIRKKASETLKTITKTIYDNSSDEIVESMTLMHSPVSELISAVRMFHQRFNQKKREKNIVDFNDLEHMCLKILKVSESAAKEYREFFEEIYVDEYQDSNLVQEEILKYLCKDDAHSGNLFMVGDVKQSIYGFRLARPDIFMGKYESFPTVIDEGPNIRIDLSDNFRSRDSVVDSVNEIFKQIMVKESGRLVYDKDAALYAKGEYEALEGYKTSFLYCNKDESINDRELEARVTADSIKKIVGKLLVKDEDGLRPAKYSDVVILLRTSKGWDNVFMKILKDEGIPVHVTSTSGYFAQTEVATLLEYLKIIDNPRQDIPLMAAMRSSFGEFSDEEIALIRGSLKSGCLFDSINGFLNIYGDNDEMKPLVGKISAFLEELQYYRNKMTYVSVDKIIAEIIDGTYGQCVKVEQNGAKKFANLNVLLNKAIEYGKTSYKGLFHFNRYIEMLHKYEVDFGEANTLDENDDAVRIMSIHKSKGLEFPVCYLCGMSKKFNLQDARASVVTDVDYGIGVDIIDPVRRTKCKSLFKNFLTMKKQNETLEEEMRLFYVAMTRAKEKLIMTTVVKEGDFYDDNVMLSKATSYLDFYRYADGKEKIKSIDDIEVTIEDLTYSATMEAIDREVNKEKILNALNGDAGELPDEVKARIAFVYPYTEKNDAVKLSVSEIKRRSMMVKDTDEEKDNVSEKELYAEEREIQEIIPSFMKDNTDNKVFSPALRGTAIHRIFEIWDYSLNTDMESVESYIETVYKEKRLESDLYELIKKEIVFDFVNSDIANRMKEAYKNNNLWREQPFVIEDDETGMLVQGIIDAYFIENEEIVLVDYKTDRVKDGQELCKKYKVQLDYYAKALSMLLGLKVKEKVIYSTALKKSIIML